MAVRTLFRHVKKIIFALSLISLLGFGALVAWVVTGPRSLAAFTPYIASALSSNDYKVKIGSLLLIWDGWRHPVGIRARDVEMLDNKGAVLAHFPEVGVRLYFFELLRGKADLKSVELLGPVAKLVEDEHGNITSFGFASEKKKADNSIAAALALLTSEDARNPIQHLQSFTIRNASLSVEDAHGNAFLTSPEASMEVTRQRERAAGRLIMPLRFNGKASELVINFMINGKTRTVDSRVNFSDIPSAVLHALAPSQRWLDGVLMPLSGWASMSSDFDANIGSIDFSLDAGPGTIDFPDQLEHKLPLQRIRLTGRLQDKLTTFIVNEGRIDFAGHSLAFKGTMHRQGNDYGVDAEADTSGIPVDDIHSYWPLKLAPHSRIWVVTRLSKGKITSANVTLAFKPGDFALKDTPEDAIHATLALKGVTVSYKPGHPPITDVDGVVHFTGRTMHADIARARYMNETYIRSGHVDFPDFYPDDVRLQLAMEVDASARDVQRFLSLPDLNKARALGLTQEVSGEAHGKATLDFIAFSENDKDDVSATGRIDYAVSAELVNVAQKKFLGNRDVADAQMKLALDNKGISVSGTASVNAVPMHIDLTSSFARNNETAYAIRTQMPVARLHDFGLPQMNFLKGSMGVEAKFISSDKGDKADAVLDLTHTNISLPAHGFSKKDGVAATLHLVTEQLPSGNTRFNAFSLKGNGYDVAGSAEYDKGMQDFSRFSMRPVRYGAMDLDSADFARKGSAIRLAAKGRVFDASPYLAHTDEQKSDRDYRIDLTAAKVILGEGREITNTTVMADCPADACREANISARLRDASLFTYKIEGGKLDANCGNAGELARVLGVFDSMEGGKMTLKGHYDAGTLGGEMEIKDYTLKNAPALTRVFTIASLSGLLDTLTGKGIYFDRLQAPFQYHHGVVVLKDAKAHGSALGLTADGLIDMNKNTLDLKGVLVPSYTLNSLVGNVPLIGNLLMGGAGKGLVALSYGMHGDMKSPSVNVNPLSVLTPGFLRDVFTIFDKPAPDMDTLKAAQKKAPETPSSPAIQPSAVSTLPSLNELKQ